tara:strand:- start:479 stop:718 length:240 start_codon:yes stop_codon:yes gene_type:complete
MSFLIFIFLITQYYFSKENVILINKSRSTYALNLIDKTSKLPILKNDTNNIIVYKNELSEFKKKSKKRIWEKLISSFNE